MPLRNQTAFSSTLATHVDRTQQDCIPILVKHQSSLQNHLKPNDKNKIYTTHTRMDVPTDTTYMQAIIPLGGSPRQTGNQDRSIPDMDEQYAVSRFDILAKIRKSAGTDSESSGLRTEDEDSCRLMASIKHNYSGFSEELVKARDENQLDEVVFNRKGMPASAVDIAAHYGRRDMAKALDLHAVRSAQGKSRIAILAEAERNQRPAHSFCVIL